MTSTAPTTQKTGLDFRNGGWVVLAAIILSLGVVAWRVPSMLRPGEGAVGDGRNVSSYGFELSNFSLDRSVLVAGQIPRDGIPALDVPQVMAVKQVAEFNDQHRGRYLVAEDRIIAVRVKNEVRGYPLRMLNWHELVNDTLAGQPILVTYHPLCDSVVVFSRVTNDHTLRFGHSGLLWNSNALYYDRGAKGDDRHTPSLWNQLLGKAIAGPAADQDTQLRVLPSLLTTFEEFQERYPDGTVLRPDKMLLKRYQRRPYDNYRRTGKLRFPVQPAANADRRVRMQLLARVAQEGSAPRVGPAASFPADVLEQDGADVRYALQFAMLNILGVDAVGAQPTHMSP